MRNLNIIACLKFQIPGYPLSGTKIDKVVIKKGPDNATKKARNIAKSGYYEIRLN